MSIEVLLNTNHCSDASFCVIIHPQFQPAAWTTSITQLFLPSSALHAVSFPVMKINKPEAACAAYFNVPIPWSTEDYLHRSIFLSKPLAVNSPPGTKHYCKSRLLAVVVHTPDHWFWETNVINMALADFYVIIVCLKKHSYKTFFNQKNFLICNCKCEHVITRNWTFL